MGKPSVKYRSDFIIKQTTALICFFPRKKYSVKLHNLFMSLLIIRFITFCRMSVLACFRFHRATFANALRSISLQKRDGYRGSRKTINFLDGMGEIISLLIDKFQTSLNHKLKINFTFQFLRKL